jgi:hypothetical protein
VLETLPRTVTWEAVEWWKREDGRLPVDVALAWEAWLTGKANGMLALAAELRAHAQKKAAQPRKRLANFKGKEGWKKRATFKE